MRLNPAQLFSTYSIVARDPETGQFGVAVETHQMRNRLSLAIESGSSRAKHYRCIGRV